MGQQQQSRDIQIDQLGHAARIGRFDRSIVANPRIVDQEVRLQVSRFEGINQAGATVGSGDIAGAGEDRDFGIGLAQFAGDGFEVLLAAGGQQEGGGERGQLTGELGPES